MSINEMERKVREMRELQALIEEATAEVEALKDAIKAAMGDSESVQAGEYRITYKAVTTARIDTAALKKALPDLAQQFTKTTTARRFCVAWDPPRQGGTKHGRANRICGRNFQNSYTGAKGRYS